jgi:hypothetical protein
MVVLPALSCDKLAGLPRLGATATKPSVFPDFSIGFHRIDKADSGCIQSNTINIFLQFRKIFNTATPRLAHVGAVDATPQ